jgi:hypothetical protein
MCHLRESRIGDRQKKGGGPIGRAIEPILIFCQVGVEERMLRWFRAPAIEMQRPHLARLSERISEREPDSARSYEGDLLHGRNTSSLETGAKRSR